jgi:hypothetical protein
LSCLPFTSRAALRGHDHINRSGIDGLQCCGEESSARERSLDVPRYPNSSGGRI